MKQLRCRKGDLAMTLRANMVIPKDAIVLVVEYVPIAEDAATGLVILDNWIVEYRGTTVAPNGITWGFQDKYLRPLRPGEGEDEMLRIAGVPTPRETTPA